jgi:hypothetical protein
MARPLSIHVWEREPQVLRFPAARGFRLFGTPSRLFATPCYRRRGVGRFAGWRRPRFPQVMHWARLAAERRIGVIESGSRPGNLPARRASGRKAAALGLPAPGSKRVPRFPPALRRLHNLFTRAIRTTFSATVPVSAARGTTSPIHDNFSSFIRSLTVGDRNPCIRATARHTTRHLVNRHPLSD